MFAAFAPASGGSALFSLGDNSRIAINLRMSEEPLNLEVQFKHADSGESLEYLPIQSDHGCCDATTRS